MPAQLKYPLDLATRESVALDMQETEAPGNAGAESAEGGFRGSIPGGRPIKRGRSLPPPLLLLLPPALRCVSLP